MATAICAAAAAVIPKAVSSTAPSTAAERGRERCSVSASRESFGANRGKEGVERDESSVVVSRRWAALVLPVVTALGSCAAAIPSRARAAEMKLECGDGTCGGVQLRTLDGCGLGVARYPDFVYNAGGGGGRGQAKELPDGRTLVRFNPEDLNIPPVSFRTTTLLGLPLPLGLEIEIVPKTLEGYVERSTGKVELNFLAYFNFTVGQLYSPPSLVVNTMLTTETAQGAFRGAKGKRLDASGDCQLVGVAQLNPVDDRFLSTFLTLPTDCLAKLSAQLSFTETSGSFLQDNYFVELKTFQREQNPLPL